ncbi:LysR substrate-binding domain-containing protein [Rhizobium sp. LEGMi135b]
MRYTQLAAFVRVIEAGGIRAGARLLGISQAAVTRSLRELEEEAGTPLIIRGSRGVRLTHDGTAAYERASIIVDQMERLDQEIKAMPSGGPRRVTFGVGAVIAQTILPQVLTTFSKRRPEVKIVVGESTVETALANLRNGTMDFIIALTSGVFLGKEFTAVPLLRTEMKIVARKGNASENAKSLQELLEAEWVLVPDEMEHRGSHHIFHDNGLPMPARLIKVMSSMISLAMFSQTDRVTVMSTPFMHLSQFRDIVAEIPVAEEIAPVVYSMIHRSDIPLSPEALELKKLFHRNFNEWGWERIA